MEQRQVQVRNSTVDFLVFTSQAGEESINVRVHEGTLWLTQKAMARLFDCSVPNINMHLKKVYEDAELQPERTIQESLIVQQEGEREVKRKATFYNLDAIISVGYRINSLRATQFRQWATGVLHQFTIRGYVLDRNRLENGQVFGEDYFEHLLDEIREIRASERRFYQKVTDIYATAVDYSPDAATSKRFFASVQNKLHYAVHRHTAAELVVERADHTKPHMGLTTWRNAPDGKIVRADVSIAKNYLSREEIQNLNELVTMYLDYAERQARNRMPMTMEDWAKKLNGFLEFNDEAVLKGPGHVSAEEAKLHAESEFELYRPLQDALYQSDFDRLLSEPAAEYIARRMEEL
ncbi:MAG: cell filamentation protein Fic [Bacteroidetes bacterium]|nr:MAG: cell filamentation protein Fic [Bacteroidota bacterium]